MGNTRLGFDLSASLDATAKIPTSPEVAINFGNSSPFYADFFDACVAVLKEVENNPPSPIIDSVSQQKEGSRG